MRPEIHIDMISNKFSIKKEQEKNRFDDPQPFCWSIKSYQKNKFSIHKWMKWIVHSYIHGMESRHSLLACVLRVIFIATQYKKQRNKIFYELFLLLDQKRHYTACQSIQSFQYVHHSDMKFILRELSRLFVLISLIPT